MVNSNCRGSYPVNRIEGAVCVCLVETVQYVVRDTMVNSNCRGSNPVNRIEGAVRVCLVGTVQYVVRDTMVNSNCRGSYACIEGADDISCVPVNRDLPSCCYEVTLENVCMLVPQCMHVHVQCTHTHTCTCTLFVCHGPGATCVDDLLQAPEVLKDKQYHSNVSPYCTCTYIMYM